MYAFMDDLRVKLQKGGAAIGTLRRIGRFV